MSHPLTNFSGIVRENEPLAPFTWLQIGGPTRFLVEPNTIEEACEVTALCYTHGVPLRILGGGSNILVRESGFSGASLLLSSPAFCQMSHSGSTVTCGAGTKLSHLIGYSIGFGLGGLEHLIAIPGTVGGAIRGNAGSDEGDISQSILSARVLSKDGTLRTLNREQLAFSHRASGLDGVAIVDVTFELNPGQAEALTKRQQTFWILKRRSQPSFPERVAVAFVDPVGFKASELIHQSGIGGAVEGAVRLSSTYPNFIIASNGATSGQVMKLLDRVKQGVLDRSGVQLQHHLQIW